MGDFTFLQYERTGDLVRIAINRPPFNVLDIATMAEMNLALEPFVEIRPMSRIEHVFDEVHHGRHTKRVILTPDF